jgi:hypothetical protein
MKIAPIREDELMAAWDAAGALREIQAAVTRGCAEEVPPGWLTVDQWASDARMSTTNAGKILRSGAAQGIVEVREFRVATGRGVRMVQHFKTKQTKGKHK